MNNSESCKFFVVLVVFQESLNLAQKVLFDSCRHESTALWHQLLDQVLQIDLLQPFLSNDRKAESL